MEVSYHTEVAQSLLLVQQAQAKLDARTLIIKGCVEIVNGAIENLKEKGIEMNEQDKHDLVKKLMVIMKMARMILVEGQGCIIQVPSIYFTSRELRMLRVVLQLALRSLLLCGGCMINVTNG